MHDDGFGFKFYCFVHPLCFVMNKLWDLWLLGIVSWCDLFDPYALPLASGLWESHILYGLEFYFKEALP